MNDYTKQPSLRLTVMAIGMISAMGCSNTADNAKTHVQQAETEAKKIDPRNGNVSIWPTLDIAVKQDPAVEAKVAELLSGMTIEQKVAQTIQPEIGSITVEDMRKYGFGSYLNGGGSFPGRNKHATPDDWIKLAEDLYQASIDDSLDGSTIPTMWGTDAVHGHNNVIGATLFPHNIGLGAANNPELIREIAEATAKEVMATGIDWVFAPTVAVVRDDRWGRTYEGYSEDPEIVKAYSASIVQGLQGAADEDFLSDQRVISTVKHFLGDGGTEKGDDQGNNLDSEQELFDIHAQGYVSGIAVGAQSVMASFNSWHGVKMHGNKYFLTDVLKDKMGFDGFVVGDWSGHGQIKGCTNEDCAQAMNAGLDIYMAPNEWKKLYENTVAQVKSGVISQARLDDAVTRILRVKVRAGLFEKPSPANRPLAGKKELIGAAEHRAVARKAVRQSLVMLKNKNQILPLKPNMNVLVAGDGADNIGKQSGGWTITWQGTGNKNSDFPGGSSIYDGIQQTVQAAGGKAVLSVDGAYQQKPDIAIVVFGEEPYAEGNGDISNLEYQRGNKTDLALLKKLKADGIPVVSVFITGRALWVNPELNASDAFVVAWLPGSEGAGVADVLFSDKQGKVRYDFTGRLSYSWPAFADQGPVNRFDEEYNPLLPYGFGLSYGDNNVLADELSEVAGSNPDEEMLARALFERSAQAPWSLTISSGNERKGMDSKFVALSNIEISTLDKDVQEDARQVKWKGGEASVSLGAAFPEDLRAYIEADAAMTIDINVESDIKGPVWLSMACDGADCTGGVDISRVLRAKANQGWTNISVALSCFEQAGADLSKVFVPFKLQSEQPLKLSFAAIKLVPESSESADVNCE
ncbi:glycoside hydrolase family 3 protein [Catenovulum sediminis]|uniref:Exo 1,3/1,4-beta-D-glucan glucohydrolase n=1 Tax=Catenovulum sediminis TaxID=1740262 RepID=A0ABV1RF52_9ALTE|nr:exo 1,3/1,4-beta-D-glucan glucohydrolase [Catenovulum sediminis]